MGILSLDDLIYFASKYPHCAQRVLESSQVESRWFPMAVTGINITAFALQLVRTRLLQNQLYNNGENETTYSEFYCYLFDGFEKHWRRMFSENSELTVMDFKFVFEKYQDSIGKQLMNKKILVIDELN